jgi:hypothetical protein
VLETSQKRYEAPHISHAISFRKRLFDLAACVEDIFKFCVLKIRYMLWIDAFDCFFELVEGVLDYQPRVWIGRRTHCVPEV